MNLPILGQPCANVSSVSQTGYALVWIWIVPQSLLCGRLSLQLVAGLGVVVH